MGPEVQQAPATFGRNAAVPPEAFDLVERIRSLPPPDRQANPLRRAKLLAMYLADDAVAGGAMVPGAGAELTRVLTAKLTGLAAEHAEALAAKVRDLEETSLTRTSWRPDADGRMVEVVERVSLRTAEVDLERDVTRILRSVREGIAFDYAKHRERQLRPAAAAAGDEVDLFTLRVEVAALFLLPEVIAELEERATKWVQEHLATHAATIALTTGAIRDRFRRVQEQTSSPEALPVELRENDYTGTVDRDGAPLPTFPGHLFADSDGRYPVALNALESTVLAAELARPGFVAWYRNPSRPVPSAVRIAYQVDGGDWSSVQVDFVIVSRRDDGELVVSLVDPHGTHLSDGRAKLRALAEYAAVYAGDGVDGSASIVRVDAIAEVDGAIRVLDLTDPAVRDAVMAYEGADLTALYASPAARDFV